MKDSCSSHYSCPSNPFWIWRSVLCSHWALKPVCFFCLFLGQFLFKDDFTFSIFYREWWYWKCGLVESKFFLYVCKIYLLLNRCAFFWNFSPRSKLIEVSAVQPNIANFGRSLLGGYCSSYVPDFVLQGIGNDERLRQCLVSDLSHAVQVSGLHCS